MFLLKSSFTNEVVFFRFFSPNPTLFYYTHTTEAVGFDIGRIDDFEPVETTWEEIKQNEL